MAHASVKAELRKRIAAMEGCSLSTGAQEVLPFGDPVMDRAFTGGGLPRGGVHEIAGAGPREGGAALGFSLALLARFLDATPGAKALLVQEGMAARENGAFYALGLQALGVDPDRLLLVSVRRAQDALWVVEEALRSGAVAAVLADLWDRGGLLDLQATRRFNLAAGRTRALGFLVVRDLRSTSAALTRWRVAAAPSRAEERLLGSPAFALSLTRNRLGRIGAWHAEWNAHDRIFRERATHPLLVARPVADRSPGATGAEPRHSPRIRVA